MAKSLARKLKALWSNKDDDCDSSNKYCLFDEALFGDGPPSKSRASHPNKSSVSMSSTGSSSASALSLSSGSSDTEFHQASTPSFSSGSSDTEFYPASASSISSGSSDTEFYPASASSTSSESSNTESYHPHSHRRPWTHQQHHPRSHEHAYSARYFDGTAPAVPPMAATASNYNTSSHNTRGDSRHQPFRPHQPAYRHHAHQDFGIAVNGIYNTGLYVTEWDRLPPPYVQHEPAYGQDAHLNPGPGAAAGGAYNFGSHFSHLGRTTRPDRHCQSERTQSRNLSPTPRPRPPRPIPCPELPQPPQPPCASLHPQQGSSDIGGPIRPANTSESKRSSCSVCLEERSLRKFPTTPITPACTHPLTDICKECIRSSISSQLSDRGTALTCPMCQKSLSHSDVQRNAKPDDFNNYDKRMAEQAMEHDPNFRWCPYGGCGAGQIQERGDAEPKATCVQCRQHFCFTHRVRWHPGLTCREFDENPERAHQARQAEEAESKRRRRRREGRSTRTDDERERGRAERDAMRKEAEERKGEKYVLESTKRCPQCRWPTSKADGCKHMTCRCSYEWCWQCQQKWVDRHLSVQCPNVK